MNILLNVRWPVGGIRTYLRYVYRQFPVGEFEITLISPPIEEFDVIKEDLGERLTKVIPCSNDSLKYFRQLNTLARSSHFRLPKIDPVQRLLRSTRPSLSLHRTLYRPISSRKGRWTNTPRQLNLAWHAPGPLSPSEASRNSQRSRASSGAPSAN